MVRAAAITPGPVVASRAARELGINDTSLGNWVRAYRKKHAGDEPPLQLSERARLRELERRNRELQMEKRIPEKSSRVLREGASVSDKYERAA